jgi:hypothetical protein
MEESAGDTAARVRVWEGVSEEVSQGTLPSGLFVSLKKPQQDLSKSERI